MNIYKKTFSYILLGAASLFSYNSAYAQSMSVDNLPPVPKVVLTNPEPRFTNLAADMHSRTERATRLSERAGNTTSQYIAHATQTRQELAPLRGTRNYGSAVRAALPGAPVGSHCLWGQYTELNRALDENGDTVTIIPPSGSRSCIAFKDQMRKKYGAPEYAGCIREGRAFESDSAYNAALAKYLRANGVTSASASEKRDELVEKFARTNFSAEQITPGSIWIVPRSRGSKTKFHAIMFLGRGKVENGQFVPTPDGKFIYTGFNRESIGDVFRTYDMSNVFSASVEDILSIEYGKELQRLESLPTDKMIEYLLDGSNLRASDLRKMPRGQLLRLVRNKYFGTPENAKQSEKIAQADVPAVMLQNMHFDRV